eukprot:3263496-Prymnesium_polylepis.1
MRKTGQRRTAPAVKPLPYSRRPFRRAGTRSAPKPPGTCPARIECTRRGAPRVPLYRVRTASEQRCRWG